MIIKEEERNKASGGGTVARVGRVTDVTMKLPDEMGRLTVELMWRRDPSDDRPGCMKLVYPSMVQKAYLQRNRGCLECFIQLDYGGSAQGFSSPIIANENSGSEKGSEKLLELLDFFGVDRLRQIQGKSVRVASKGFNQKVEKLVALYVGLRACSDVVALLRSKTGT